MRKLFTLLILAFASLGMAATPVDKPTETPDGDPAECTDASADDTSTQSSFDICAYRRCCVAATGNQQCEVLPIPGSIGPVVQGIAQALTQACVVAATRSASPPPPISIP